MLGHIFSDIFFLLRWWCINLCTSCFLLTIWIESIQIKPNEESNDDILDLQDDETGLKKDADLLLDQVLTGPDIILSTCSQNDTSSTNKSKYSVS